jgi:c-di-GMP-binding flagellar brake protein YcgR
MEHVSPNSCLIPGYPLQLELVDDVSDAPSAGIYPSMVIGLESHVLHVDIPKLDGRRVTFPEGTAFRVVSMVEGAHYSFDSHVTGYEEGIPLAMCLAPPKTVRRSQRREAVRVPTDLYGRVGAEGQDMGVKLRDISAGGVSFFCDRPLKGRIEMTVNLSGASGQDWVYTKLFVRRVVPTKSDFIIACSFTDMELKDEDRIVAYLFRRQRQLRQMSSTES